MLHMYSLTIANVGLSETVDLDDGAVSPADQGTALGFNAHLVGDIVGPGV